VFAIGDVRSGSVKRVAAAIGEIPRGAMAGCWAPWPVLGRHGAPDLIGHASMLGLNLLAREFGPCPEQHRPPRPGSIVDYEETLRCQFTIAGEQEL
jgi:hypothetical protein